MKKIVTTSVLCLLLYFLPLIGRPELYFDWRFGVVVFFFYLIFLTQPAFKAVDIKEHSDTDKYSMLFITIGLIITLSGSIMEWAYFDQYLTQVNDSVFMLTGLVLLITGSALRIWAILHLGKYFTNSVEFGAQHQLIKSGPYKVVRHPSYLGAYLAIIGSTLFLGAIIFSLIGAMVMLLVYLYRIKVEEVGLQKIFPGEYRKYQKETSMIFPLL